MYRDRSEEKSNWKIYFWEERMIWIQRDEKFENKNKNKKER